MTFQSPIVKKTNTLLNETIHITLECAMHLHGHRNKMMSFMKPSILTDLNNGACFISTLVGQLMTLEATISYVTSITTTLATKTWSFRVM
jgi:hypothetical protein